MHACHRTTATASRAMTELSRDCQQPGCCPARRRRPAPLFEGRLEQDPDGQTHDGQEKPHGVLLARPQGEALRTSCVLDKMEGTTLERERREVQEMLGVTSAIETAWLVACDTTTRCVCLFVCLFSACLLSFFLSLSLAPAVFPPPVFSLSLSLALPPALPLAVPPNTVVSAPPCLHSSGIKISS